MLKVGILGATGMVGQRFISLLENHPWFTVTTVAASTQSKGKPYHEAVGNRWAMKTPIPEKVKNLIVYAVEEDLETIAEQVDFVFSAMDLEKDQIKNIEEAYASRDVPVVSNNSAHRWTEDVPMIMPELNHDHLAMIDEQRKNRGWKKGFIVVKPNCSLQSYLPLIYALRDYEPTVVSVTTLQAISGAGKTFETWPEMVDNVIPFIGGEEEKTEKEPLKILGTLSWQGDKKILVLATSPRISATCIRVPASDGHMASVSVRFAEKVSKEEILETWKNFNPLADLHLPSSPTPFIRYFEEENRPQTRLDRDEGKGMGISAGRLSEDPLSHWKWIALSHNTIRGAAGGAILSAELLKAKGYL